MTVAIVATDAGSQSASGTTASNALLTIPGGVTALLGILWINVSSGAPTMHWDSLGTNQSMTQLGTIANGTVNTYFFGLLAPTAGTTLTLSASWTGSSPSVIGAQCYSGTATDTLAHAFTNFRSNTGSSTTGTVTSAGATGNLNVCAMGAGTTPGYSALATTGSTVFLTQNTNIACTAGSAPSAASLVWTATLNVTNPWTAISIDVSVPASATIVTPAFIRSPPIQIWDH